LCEDLSPGRRRQRSGSGENGKTLRQRRHEATSLAWRGSIGPRALNIPQRGTLYSRSRKFKLGGRFLSRVSQ
jgi:hypothetical protein